MTSSDSMPVTDLPVYSPGRRCPKCGSSGVGTEHVPAGHDLSSGRSWAHGRNLDYPNFREHMRRLCNKCLHAWMERPLDQ